VILDSSALVAIVLREPAWEAAHDKLAAAELAAVGAPTLAETGLVLSARLAKDPRAILSRVLHEFRVAIVPFGEPHWLEAVNAYRRYGKGRHEARLNFGDCMSYATAKLAGRPLLCVGGDFAKTDLELA
jgi:ribonuclease VapC